MSGPEQMPVGWNPPPTPNPYHWESGDLEGDLITIDFTWDNTTRALTAINVHRDAACSWNTILIGLGSDGSPDTTLRAVTVPVGNRTLTSAQLSALATRGLASIDDVLTLQITATTV
jgi:hypothetical protein